MYELAVWTSVSVLMGTMFAIAVRSSSRLAPARARKSNGRAESAPACRLERARPADVEVYYSARRD